MKPLLLFSALALVASGCTASRAIAPLEKGQVALQGSIGGPMFTDLGFPLPAPIASVGAGYGITDKLTFRGALYTNGMLLFRNFGMDAGVSYELLPADGPRPRLMIDGGLGFFYGKADPQGVAPTGARLFIDTSFIASWDLGKPKHHIYLGLQAYTQPFPTFNIIPAPVFGAEVKAGPVGFVLETKWLAPWVNNEPFLVQWVGPGRLGAVSVQAGMNIYLGGKK